MTKGVRVSTLKPSDPTWASLVSGVDHDVYHLPEWMEFAAMHEGGRSCALFSELNGAWLFIPLVLHPIADSIQGGQVRYSDAVSPYGYPTILTNVSQSSSNAMKSDLSAALHACIEALRELGAVSLFVRLHPLLPIAPLLLQERGTIVRHGETVHIDLTLSDDILWRQLRTSHRQDISASIRRGDRRYIDAEWSKFDEFMEIYYQNMHRAQADPYYFFKPQELLGLRRGLGNRVHLSVVEIGGRVASAGIVTEVNGIAQDFISGTHSDFLKQCPNKSRLEYISRWAKARGNRLFHLGGGLGGRHDSLFDFKHGFSPLRSPFDTWRVVLNREVFDRLVAIWEIEPGATSHQSLNGYFPPYRQKVD